MRIAIIQFPGSNCDWDCYHALKDNLGQEPQIVWHKETDLSGFDVLILPGGFSYGDYLRSGAIARFSPVMRSLVEQANAGKLVIGICNGFQILCEIGLLPGVLIRNRSLHFVCKTVYVKIESVNSPFTHLGQEGQVLRLPVAHGDGCYYASEEVLHALETSDQVLLRYTSPGGEALDAANPNGSASNIAGICNRQRNIFGLMPHPERACEKRLGSTDGQLIFKSMLEGFCCTA